jgi:hypothetical protein
MNTYIYVLVEITQNPMSYSGECAENIIGAFEDEESAKVYKMEYKKVANGLGLRSNVEYCIDKIELIKLNKIKKARQ